jgi:hypothetical protein
VNAADPLTLFYMHAGMPAEAVLFEASVARLLDGMVRVAILEEEPVDLVERDPKLAKLRVEADELDASSRAIVWNDRESPVGMRFAETWRLAPSVDNALELRLDTPRGRHRFPFSISPELVSQADRIESDVPRLLVPLGSPNNRRERMTIRVVEELRRREWRHLLVAAGAGQPDFARALAPDELYEEPTAGELAALLMSSSALLDASDESAQPTVLGRLARCLGTCVVVHASSPLAHPFAPEVRLAQEWSPDAFCDVLMSRPSGGEPELPWNMEFDAIAEDFGRILKLG